MRLLKRDGEGGFCLTNDLIGSKIPPYAILSHVWGQESDEVTFQNLLNRTGRDKVGYDKIYFCADQAERHGLEHFWIDTCCINKENPWEFSTAINSMFTWYRKADQCYVLLSDVSAASCEQNSQSPISSCESTFRGSRWFTRGWTLQELLAPASVQFFASDATCLGDRTSLQQHIHDITGIAVTALQGRPLGSFGVEERFEWAKNRLTKYEEDWAYCLLGIFGVSMPLVYGEGRKQATRRLKRTIFEEYIWYGGEAHLTTEDFIREITTAFENLQPLLYEARAQEERCKAKTHDAAEALKGGDMLITAARKALFLSLQALLWAFWWPLGAALTMLDNMLDENSASMQSIIETDKKLSSELQREQEHTQKILHELKASEDTIRTLLRNQKKRQPQATDVESSCGEAMQFLEKIYPLKAGKEKENDEQEWKAAVEARIVRQQEEEIAGLKKEVSDSIMQSKQLQEKLEVALEEATTKQTHLERVVASLEAAAENADRIRRENEEKTVWQKIKAWISWLLGQDS